MLPPEISKHLILVVVAILIFGLSIIVLQWPQGKHKSFSQHVAVRKLTICYYILLFSIVLPLLVLFFVNWFVPHFKLPVWFSVCIVLSAIFQYAATLVPEVGGWKTLFHRVVTAASALLLLPALLALALSESVDTFVQIAIFFSLIVMIGTITLTLFYKNKKYLLPLQTCYYGAFFLAIIIATYY